MPSIPKGAKISDEDKKRIDKLKKKGATKSELATVRMALLRGHTYRKAMTMMRKKKAGASKAKPMDTKKEKEPMAEEIMGEEEAM